MPKKTKPRMNITAGLTMTRYKHVLSKHDFSQAPGAQERQRRIRQQFNRLKNILKPHLVQANPMVGVVPSEVEKHFFPGKYLAAGSPHEAFKALAELDELWKASLKPVECLPEIVLVDEAVDLLSVADKLARTKGKAVVYIGDQPEPIGTVSMSPRPTNQIRPIAVEESDV